MNRLDEIEEFLGSVNPYSEECLEDISCTRSWTLWSDENLDDMLALLKVAQAAVDLMHHFTEPLSDAGADGWEGVSMADYGRLKALVLALKPLLVDVPS